MWLNGLVFKDKDYFAPAQHPLSFLSQSARFFPVLAQQASPLEHLLESAFLFLEQAVFSVDLLQDFSDLAHFLAQADFSAEAHFFSFDFLLQHPLFADFSHAFFSDLLQDFSVFAHFLAQLDFSAEAHFCSVLTSSLVVFVLCAKATFTNKPKVSNNKILFIVLNF